MARREGCRCDWWNRFPSISYSGGCPVSLHDGVAWQMNFIIPMMLCYLRPGRIKKPTGRISGRSSGGRLKTACAAGIRKSAVQALRRSICERMAHTGRLRKSYRCAGGKRNGLIVREMRNEAAQPFFTLQAERREKLTERSEGDLRLCADATPGSWKSGDSAMWTKSRMKWSKKFSNGQKVEWNGGDAGVRMHEEGQRADSPGNACGRTWSGCS